MAGVAGFTYLRVPLFSSLLVSDFISGAAVGMFCSVALPYWAKEEDAPIKQAKPKHNVKTKKRCIVFLPKKFFLL